MLIAKQSPAQQLAKWIAISTLGLAGLFALIDRYLCPLILQGDGPALFPLGLICAGIAMLASVAPLVCIVALIACRLDRKGR
jgi:hypothetical protein